MSTFFEPISNPGSVLLAGDPQGSSSVSAAVLLFEAGPWLHRPGLVSVGKLRAELASRLHRLPALRRRVVRSPLLSRAFWVDDTHFDPSEHIRHVRLARNVGERGLKSAVGALLSRPLHRSRPLWEFWIVDGFEKNRFALVAKVHPCFSGLSSAAKVSCELLDGSARSAASDEPPCWLPAPAPGRLRLALDDLTYPLWLWRKLVSEVAVRWPRSRQSPAETLSGALGPVRAGVGPLRHTSRRPSEARIGEGRRTEWFVTSLEEVERASRALGASLEGCSLTSVARAVRRRRGRAGLSRDTDEIRVLFAADLPEGSRALEGWDRLRCFSLPIAEADPETRLARVEASLESRTEGIWQALQGRLPSHLLVAEASGASEPLYLGSSMLLAVFSIPPLLPGQDLAIGLFRYAGTLSWSFSAPPEDATDLASFAFDLAVGFCELLERAETPRLESGTRAKTGS
jgi:diacylglycerol O-acyltransferase